MSAMTPVVLVTAAMGMNTVYQLRHGNDVFPVVLSGGLWMGTCVLVGAASPEIGTALAAVFLLSVFLTRGVETLNWLTELGENA